MLSMLVARHLSLLPPTLSNSISTIHWPPKTAPSQPITYTVLFNANLSSQSTPQLPNQSPTHKNSSPTSQYPSLTKTKSYDRPQTEQTYAPNSSSPNPNQPNPTKPRKQTPACTASFARLATSSSCLRLLLPIIQSLSLSLYSTARYVPLFNPLLIDAAQTLFLAHSIHLTRRCWLPTHTFSLRMIL